jgi:hypothetical protein
MRGTMGQIQEQDKVETTAMYYSWGSMLRTVRAAADPAITGSSRGCRAEGALAVGDVDVDRRPGEHDGYRERKLFSQHFGFAPAAFQRMSSGFAADSPLEEDGFEPSVPLSGHRSHRDIKEAGCRSGISE